MAEEQERRQGNLDPRAAVSPTMRAWYWPQSLPQTCVVRDTRSRNDRDAGRCRATSTLSLASENAPSGPGRRTSRRGRTQARGRSYSFAPLARDDSALASAELRPKRSVRRLDLLDNQDRRLVRVVVTPVNHP